MAEVSRYITFVSSVGTVTAVVKTSFFQPATQAAVPALSCMIANAAMKSHVQMLRSIFPDAGDPLLHSALNATGNDLDRAAEFLLSQPQGHDVDSAVKDGTVSPEQNQNPSDKIKPRLKVPNLPALGSCAGSLAGRS